jgi:UDP-3-O-[3-hydroxymyristoyl] glucosamine N-acyltransferase
MKAISLAYVAEITGGIAVGDASRAVCGVCAPEACADDKLCVVWKESSLQGIPLTTPLLARKGLLRGHDGIEHDSPREALADILPLFDPRERPEAGVHPTAVIGAGCEIAPSAHIGPCCVVSDGAMIGSGAVLQANVYVGKSVTVGICSTLEAGVAVHDFVKIGSRVILHSGVTVGCDGFGHVPAPDGSWKKIPQIGTVVIEDNVEVGPNSTIDRATFGVTRVRRGVKLGSLLHIAHNCDIGEDSVIAGCSAVGGSAKIGRGAVIAGMAGIADHVSIGSGVTVAGRSGVTKDVKDGMTISGFPAQDRGTENRFQASLRRVRDMAERLGRLEKLFSVFSQSAIDHDAKKKDN